MLPLKTLDKKVLLIDDDEDEYDIFQVAAEKSNLPIALYYIGECNREKLKTFPKPDLIFLDINMPLHNGFDWLKGIREKVPELIPIIMYSTTRSEEKVRMAYDLGANLFITKPNSTQMLSEALQWVLQLDWTNPKKVAEESFAKKKFHMAF